MKNWKVITALVLTGGIGYAAYRYFMKQKQLLEDYAVKPISFSFLKTTATETIIVFVLRITNKSDIEATMSRMYADAYLHNLKVGELVSVSPAIIPAKGTADIKLQLTFNPKQISEDLVPVLVGIIVTRSLDYRLKGFVKLKTGFIPVSVPFDESGNIKDLVKTATPGIV